MNSLGRYKILQQIGTGSMGTVYRATDPLLEREVALKIIRTSGTVDAEIRERFYREARACARLQHRNIVAVFDLGEVDRVAFIAMELLRGSDFRKLIEQRQAIGVAEKIQAMIDVCEALDHAHRHGVIHRDVKPSNLFLEENGRAKVTDFGIARLPSSKLTIHGNILGTPNYMAPEQIEGKPSDARSDLFSAGLVFFEMLVYVHPFRGAVITRRIREGQPDSLFDHDSSLPVLLEKILNRALSHDPRGRYASGAEFASDLRAVLDAIRMNASPTMSKIVLPSDRTDFKPETRVDGDPTLLNPAPAGEDPAEWRLSEVLRLIPDFEEAVDRQDEAAARKALQELKAIAAVDMRFLEAAESCQNSYEKSWGTTLIETTIDEVSPPVSIEDQADGAIRTDGMPTETFTGPGADRHEARTWWHFSAEQKKVLIGSIAACVLMVLIGWGASQWRSIPLEPALGTVRVRAPSTAIREAPRPDAKSILEVRQGDHLRLLELPTDRSATWLHVQAVAQGNVTVPGYASLADITDWTEWVFDKPASAARVALMMNPGENAPETQLAVYIERLQMLATKLEGQPEGEQARAIAEQLEKARAQRQAPPPPSIPEPEPEPAKPVTTEPVPSLTVEQLVQRGRNFLARYAETSNPSSLQQARRDASRALRLNKDHSGARELLADVEIYEKVVVP